MLLKMLCERRLRSRPVPLAFYSPPREDLVRGRAAEGGRGSLTTHSFYLAENSDGFSR